MGGSAFNSTTAPGGPLHVPRIPTEVHAYITKECITSLQKFFKSVRSPREPPEKKDHGDVDILVGNPLTKPETFVDSKGVSIPKDVRTEIARSFQAERWTTDAPHSSNFAFPLPESFRSKFPELFKDGERSFVQVDVHLTSPEFFEWMFFKQSHGDFWQLLGMMIRPFGITANESGLYFRVIEVEKMEGNRRASLLYLTRDVDKTQKFLGLDPVAFNRGFETESQLFEFVTSCKFFKRAAMLDRGEFENANDRQRYKKRPMFRRFLDEWLPSSNNTKDGDAADWEVTDVLESAVQMFGEHIGEAHTRMQESVRSRKLEDEFFKQVREELPKEDLISPRIGSLPQDPTVSVEVSDRNINEKRNLVVRGLRRWVEFDPQTNLPYIRETPQMDTEKYPVWKLDPPERFAELREWVRQNWKTVRDLEKERVKAAIALGKLAKENPGGST